MSDMEGVHKVCKIIPHEEIYNAENQSQGIHQAVGDDFLLAGPVGDSTTIFFSGLDSIFSSVLNVTSLRT